MVVALLLQRQSVGGKRPHSGFPMFPPGTGVGDYMGTLFACEIHVNGDIGRDSRRAIDFAQIGDAFQPLCVRDADEVFAV